MSINTVQWDYGRRFHIWTVMVYQIIVTIFAEDENGDSDSRSKTFTVTAR